VREHGRRETRPHPVDAALYDTTYFLGECDGYEEFAATAGRVLPERLAKVLAYADIEPGMRVLDVGSGRGESLVWLARQGAEAWGLDYAADALRLTLEAVHAADLRGSERCRLLAANARHLPLVSEAFDRALMLDIVEHLHPWELEQALSEVWRVLRPGGKLIVHTAPNLWYYRFGYSTFRMAQRLRGVRLPRDPRQRYHYHTLVHVNEQSPLSLRRVLQRRGFRSRVWLQYSAEEVEGQSRRMAQAANLVQWLPVLRWIFRNHIVAIAVKP
jgi:ubiquinone/menaquinone biosynthesis C-methylase UbiE